MIREESVGDYLHEQYVLIFKSITSKQIRSLVRDYDISGDVMVFVCRGRTKVKQRHLKALNELMAIAMPIHTLSTRKSSEALEYAIKNKKK